MSIPRRPRSREEEQWQGVRVQRTGGAHSLNSAAPLRDFQVAVADAVASLTGAGGDRTSQVDHFTLAASAAEDFTLTFLPQPDSWNVTIGDSTGATVGLDEDEGDFSVDGQTLSILAGCDPRVGEKVRIQYDYLTGIPAVAQDPFTGLINSLGPMWWGRLSDVSNGGVLTDSSGHARHGLWNSVTTHTLTSGLILDDPDQALSMTGSGGEGGNVASASWMNLTQDMTWVIFFKTTDTSARLWSREATSGGVQDWSLQQGSQLYFATGGSTVLTSIRTGLNDDNIHMAMYRKSSTAIDLSIDGVLDNSVSHATPLPTTAQDMYLGYGGGLTSAHMFAGVLDEAIWFDKLLTDAEGAAIWEAAT